MDDPVAKMRKGELHVHLNGAVPSSTIQRIIGCEGTDVPPGFDLNTDLVRQSACASLRDYLKPWQVLRRIPSRPEHLRLLTDGALSALAQNGVTFAEVRSTVLYLGGLQNCSNSEALARLLDSLRSSANRFGLACGLVLTVTRGDYSAAHLDALLRAYEDLGCPPDVVGLDLAGDEDIPIPSELPALFRQARERHGLGITIHAGETGNAANVLSAIHDFEADRIGHATAAGLDARVMDALRENDVCVEVCPISNRLTGAINDGDVHPLREFEARGVPFVVCSDNPGIHQRGLNDDYWEAAAEGIEVAHLAGQLETAKRYTFLRIE